MKSSKGSVVKINVKGLRNLINWKFVETAIEESYLCLSTEGNAFFGCLKNFSAENENWIDPT